MSRFSAALHTGGRAHFRTIDPRADVDLLHTWLHAPHVRPWWDDVARPPADLVRYLETQTGAGHSEALLASLAGRPIGYFEVYWAARDPLAGFYDADEHDQGVHLLLGPADLQGRGLGAALLDAVAGWQLGRQPATRRVVAEPDARNTRAHRAFARAGFSPRGLLDLPAKQALLMVRER